MDLEVRHLRLVLAVATDGSLTAAADRLHLTQSALSHQLRDIEDRLGTALFLRRNRRMMPTPAGQRVFGLATRVLDEIERTEGEVRDIAEDRQGVLRLATERYTCYHWLPDVLKKFGRTCPGVEVRIEVGATARPLEAVLAGKLDLAIMTSVVRDPRLATTPLFHDELQVVMADGHALSRRPFIRPEDLADQTVFTHSSREEAYAFQTVLTPAGVEPRVRQVQVTEAILELIGAGLGVAMLARWAVEPYLRARTLVGVPLTRHGLMRQWSAVVPQALAGTGYVTEFLRLVAAVQSTRGRQNTAQATRAERHSLRDVALRDVPPGA